MTKIRKYLATPFFLVAVAFLTTALVIRFGVKKTSTMIDKFAEQVRNG